MSLTRTSDWKPLPSPGYPTLAQRVAAMQHSSLSRSSSLSSSSTSSSSITTLKRNVVMHRGYAILLPRDDFNDNDYGEKEDQQLQITDKDDSAIPTSVTITTTSATTTTTTSPELLSRDDDDVDKSPLEYDEDNDDDDYESRLEEHDNLDNDDEDDDNICWEYDDLDDDSMEKAFKESQRPRFLRYLNKDLYPRDLTPNTASTMTTEVASDFNRQK